jgi:purine-binding chemotaxis protein CheW
MNATLEMSSAARDADVELVTFYVGDLLLGAEIRHVEEINRHVDFTPVPHAPEFVRGVVNLRGEVVTVLDLRTILGLGQTEPSKDSRNVVVNAGGDRIGLLVDRIADVVNTQWGQIDLPPANLTGVQGRFLQGVYKLERELLAVLDIAEVLLAASEAA